MIKNKKELLKNLPTHERKEREILLDIAEKTLKAINPYTLVLNELAKHNFSKYDRIFVIGTGKGTAKMAEAAEKHFGNKITDGFITIPSARKRSDSCAILSSRFAKRNSSL